METLVEERGGLCAECGAQVRMLTAFDAAVLAGVSSYTIYRWAEDGAIHHRTTPRGVLLVCPRSLPHRREAQGSTPA